MQLANLQTSKESGQWVLACMISVWKKYKHMVQALFKQFA